MTSNVAFERSFADLLNGYEFSVVRPSDWHKLAKQVVPFLVADTQLYKRLCPSVSLLVRWYVGLLVRWSLVRPWTQVKKRANEHFRWFLCMDVGCEWGLDAPVHLSATIL